MSLLEKRHTQQQQMDPSDGMPETGGDQGGNLRERAQAAWTHLDDALDRALSTDSSAFLAATQQYGGQ